MTPTSRTTVIIHAAEPDPLVAEVLKQHDDIHAEPCNTYEGLPGVIEALRPSAVFSIRFAGTPGFPRDSLLGPNGPGWIAVGGSGVDHLGAWDPRKTVVTNSAGVAAGMMAQYVIGSILHFTLDIAGLECERAAHHWTGRIMTSVEGKTVLIIGLGHTGRSVAAGCKALGMNVIGVRANPRMTDNVDAVHGIGEIAALWAKADAIVVCAPLLDSTRGLVGANAFSAMKPGAVLVDVSRGGIVVQSALIEALRSGALGGAALDVFETEPLPEDNPLWDLEKVLISPHCSSVFDGWEVASIRLFRENLTRWRNGEELVNVVDPARGY
jgi:phosphoglycerate dehydrogenase-like enzyme